MRFPRPLGPRNDKTAKFFWIAFGLPFALAFFWSGRDAVELVRNLWKIRSLNHQIAERQKAKEELGQEIALLEQGDRSAWKKVYRQDLHAQHPNELEYRILSKRDKN